MALKLLIYHRRVLAFCCNERDQIANISGVNHANVLTMKQLQLALGKVGRVMQRSHFEQVNAR